MSEGEPTYIPANGRTLRENWKRCGGKPAALLAEVKATGVWTAALLAGLGVGGRKGLKTSLPRNWLALECASYQCLTTSKFSVSVNQPVVGWLEGLWYPRPTRDQILVLAFILGFISGFPAMHIQWEETFPSTTRCLR